jgi:O-methyltransferase/IclR-like helix-turn-helix domain-containing protein
MEHQVPPQTAIMHIIAGYWLSRSVYLAARLKLADAIGDGELGLPDLAAKTGTSPTALRRLMRALTSHGFFLAREDGRYAQSPLSETLRTARPGSMRGLAEAELGHDHYEAWGQVETCLRHDGTAFERIYGMPIWRYYGEHPETEALFAEAMSNFTTIAHAGILGSYEFPPFKMAIDVGGGHGAFLKAVIDSKPDARGILFDVPTVIAEAEQTGAIANGNIRGVGGDFFKEVPAGGDLYLLKFILHDWKDEQSIQILTSVRKAIVSAGRLVIVEIVLPNSSEPHVGPLIDLNMMVMTGGIERTELEYRQLLGSSGFRLERVVATKSPFSIIEAVPV